ncbi:hypothetical protein [Guptibacillus sedimenti]|uniref:hypothetical protein n=1 Tax=Guptibacillus sedimenti TaxID=3025680 RepID=UPI00235DF525|nr:hypothetical protein [Pseudalkalibacillus sedimenti]
MQILLPIISLATIVFIVIYTLKNKSNKKQSSITVILLIVASLSALMAFFTNSYVSIIFYFIHLSLLILALIRETKLNTKPI